MTGALGAARVMLGAALDWLYPPSCLVCDAPAQSPHGLCAACWREARLIEGAVCESCGAPFEFAPAPGEAAEAAFCLDCRERARPWRRGRAACLYDGSARQLVLALKRRDRLEAARPMGAWMARAGAELLRAEGGERPWLAPVPLHWTRRAARRFNQSLELARIIAETSGAPLLADALRRRRRTATQGGRGVSARRENVAGAFALSPSGAQAVVGRRVVLVDDVMTTGATLEECARVLRDGGADSVDVLVFARAARDPFSTRGAFPISIDQEHEV